MWKAAPIAMLPTNATTYILVSFQLQSQFTFKMAPTKFGALYIVSCHVGHYDRSENFPDYNCTKTSLRHFKIHNEDRIKFQD